MATSEPAPELRSVNTGAAINGLVTLLFTRSMTTHRASTPPVCAANSTNPSVRVQSRSLS